MLKLNCYAKINLVLNVLHKRTDGYHELQTVMQSVSLADRLVIKKISDQTITIKTNYTVTENPTDNLAYKAARLFLTKYQIKSGVEIILDKKIPLAAGLAGGSADCAGVLIGLNKLHRLNLSLTDLEQLANQMGSDVAFCLHGGTMLAEGRGEKLTALPAVGTKYGLLLKPPCALATAKVYEAIPKDFIKTASKTIFTAFTQKSINNDLYPFALKIKPELAEYLKIVKKTKPFLFQMSGSGPTIFAFYRDKAAREKALKLLQAYEVYPVETIDKSYEFL